VTGYLFSELDTDKLYDTLTMIRDVFMEFEAPDYSKEGIEEFLRFLEPDEIQEKLDDKSLRMWVCEVADRSSNATDAKNNGEIIGAIAASEDHINLLFVAAQHHRKGIARQLVETMKDNYKPSYITVNSSPYAVEAYRKLGFTETDTEQQIKGIRYTPMKWE